MCVCVRALTCTCLCAHIFTVTLAQSGRKIGAFCTVSNQNWSFFSSRKTSLIIITSNNTNLTHPEFSESAGNSLPPTTNRSTIFKECKTTHNNSTKRSNLYRRTTTHTNIHIALFVKSNFRRKDSICITATACEVPFTTWVHNITDY